ncbi:anti-sigma factor [Nonomuraea typhae]|uniref:anti-sigma factor n=1 Tax=Nonomuraea typhae TaxID=2603600 RepID=UPI0012F7FB21|nr:anti-sigma factor [Nonomuraea typhae]
MNEDLHALTGAYAVHALPGPESVRFERHLARCADCRREVRHLRETAARLALAAAEPPPAALRQRVIAAARQVRQAHAPAPGGSPATVHPWPVAGTATPAWRTGNPVVTWSAPAPAQPVAQGRENGPAGEEPEGRVAVLPGRWARRATTGLAAVSTAAALVLGAFVIQGQRELGEARRGLAAQGQARDAAERELAEQRTATTARQREMMAVVAAPDARTMRRPVAAGGSATIVVSRARGRMVLAVSGLPEPEEGKAYKLWLMEPAGPRPLGMLGARNGMMRPVPKEGVARVVLTLEPEAGPERPTTVPLMLAELPPA